MSFILVPKNGEEIKINAWNWRPTLQLLREAGIIDDDLFERMGTHGCKAEVMLTRPVELRITLELECL